MNETPNGKYPAGLGIDAATLIGNAVARELRALIAEAVPALGQTIAAAVAQVPAMTGESCVTCLTARLQWETARRRAWEQVHGTELAAAKSALMAAAGVSDENDPRLDGADLSPWLPEHLRDGAPAGPPAVRHRMATWQGSGYCAQHLPAAAPVAAPEPPPQPAEPVPPEPVKPRTPLIAAQGIGSVHAAAQIAKTAQGLPGVPEDQAQAMRG